jgi:hypothetical protein
MRPITALLLAALLVSAPSSARAGTRLSVTEGAVVRAGATVTLEWSGVPLTAHELELEWSLPGGRWRRLSPELSSSVTRYAWRVPAHLAGEVHVRLRHGGVSEETAGEALVVEVVAAPSLVHEGLTDDWWDEHGLDGSGASGAWSDAAPAWSVADDSPQAASAPVAPMLPPARPADRFTAPSEGHEAAVGIATRSFRAPRLAPQRN